MALLKIENVSKDFTSSISGEKLVVLDEITFTVAENEFICILGPSGCGKSTLLRLISGLSQPSSGRITLGEEIVTGTSVNRGMAFQKTALFPWLTVKQNIEFTLKMQGTLKNNKEKVDTIIDLIGLTDYRNAYPSQLSGGMAQRVSLARTMINEPEVFLLDEPLGALDAFTRMNMQDELLKLFNRKGNRMIMVTHDIEEAIYMGNRVIVMSANPGEIQKDIKIELPYPRNRSSQKFIDYRNQVLNILHLGNNE